MTRGSKALFHPDRAVSPIILQGMCGLPPLDPVSIVAMMSLQPDWATL